MSTKVFEPRLSEFYNRRPENYLLVENHENGVTIRAAFNNFSERRRMLFIRSLSAEGFIPDEYQFFSNSFGNETIGVRWLIDASWLRLHPEVAATARRRLWGLYFAALIIGFAVVGWIAVRSA